MNIVWSQRARNDLEAVFNYYVLKSPVAAVKLHNAILDDIQLLTRHPNMAPIEPLLEGEKYLFRSLVTKSGLHKIIYFVDKESIFIYRIWNCRQNPKDLKPQ